MTPAVILLNQRKLTYQLHEYQHSSSIDSYGAEAVDKLQLPAAQVFKTLVVQADSEQLFVAIVPVTAQLSLKLMAKVVKAKKVKMALAEDVLRSTGYVLGGVSPLGQKKKLTTVIDSSAQNYQTVFVSAGKRGLELELSPTILQQVSQAKFAAISAR